MHIDWWYDTRRLGRTDVESLSRHFSAALLDLTAEALIESDIDDELAGDELALVDLSSIDTA
jgi:phthiocerol/phenolphthiocerol synthesis type-I polyketide synthase E